MVRIRNSLKSVIAAQLVLLLLASMLLVNVVIIKLFEKDAIKARIIGARAVIEAFEKSAAAFSPETGKDSDPVLSALAAVSSGMGYRNLTVISSAGTLLYPTQPQDGNPTSVAAALTAADSGRESLEFTGRTWGVVWFAYRTAKLAAPLVVENRTLGATALEIPLEPAYSSLRNSQRAVLLYMALNTFFLTLFGTYRLSRSMVQPLRRLIAATEQFTGEQPFPSLYEGRSTEIGRVHRSIHAMLTRLEHNKEELRNQLVRLEKSNRDLKEAHREIITAEKLASIGRLATGVSHEIGNPVGIVLGYLDIIKSGKLSSLETSDFLARIETEVTKIHSIVRQMLDFARPASGCPGRISLQAAVSDAIAVLELHPMMSRVKVHTTMDCDPDIVFADANQLQQVIINIIINAVDAMAESADPEIFLSTHREDDLIRLSIRDSGPGVDEDALDRLFEPFYTTKEPGKGTGMGLAVCYRIVEAVHGTIHAANSEAGGLTVTVELPLCIEKS